MIDFASVSAGLKEIDDFEEISYQPPEQLGDLSEEDQTNRKRTDSASSVTRKDQNRSNTNNNTKYLNKKSNANITASKLKQLASKRKNKPNQRKHATTNDNKRRTSSDGGLPLLTTSMDEDTCFHDEMITMHTLNTSKEFMSQTSGDEVSNTEKASTEEISHPEKTSEDDVSQLEKTLDDEPPSAEKESGNEILPPLRAFHSEQIQSKEDTDVKLTHLSRETDHGASISKELFTTNQSDQREVAPVTLDDEPLVSTTSRDHISNANDASNASIKSQDNIFFIMNRDFPCNSSNDNEPTKHLNISDLTFPDRSLSNHEENSKLLGTESSGISVISSSTDQIISGDTAGDLMTPKVSVIQSDITSNDLVSSSKESQINSTRTPNPILSNNEKPATCKTDTKTNPEEVDFTVVSSTTKPQDLSVIEISSDSQSNILGSIADQQSLGGNDATINILSDRQSQDESVVEIQQPHVPDEIKDPLPDKESSSELDSEVEIIMSKSRIPLGVLQFSTPKVKIPPATNVDVGVLHGENAQFNGNISKTSNTVDVSYGSEFEPNSLQPAPHYNHAVVSQGFGMNHLSLAHELTFPDYPVDSSTTTDTIKTTLDRESTVSVSNQEKHNTNPTSKSCERHLSFADLIPKKRNATSWNSADDDDTVSSTEKQQSDVSQSNDKVIEKTTTVDSKQNMDGNIMEEEDKSEKLFKNVVKDNFCLKTGIIDKDLCVQLEPIDLSQYTSTHLKNTSFMAAPQRNCYSACTVERCTTPPNQITISTRYLNSDTKVQQRQPFETFKDHSKIPSTVLQKERQRSSSDINKTHILRTSAEILKDSSTRVHKSRKNRPSRRLTGNSKDIMMLASAEELADKSDFFSGDSMDSVRSEVSLLDMMSPRHPSCSSVSNVSIKNTTKGKKRAKVTTLELSKHCDSGALCFVESQGSKTTTIELSEQGDNEAFSFEESQFTKETSIMSSEKGDNKEALSFEESPGVKITSIESSEQCINKTSSILSSSPSVTTMKDETPLLEKTSNSSDTNQFLLASPKDETKLTPSLLSTSQAVAKTKNKATVHNKETSSSFKSQQSNTTTTSCCENPSTSSLATSPVITKAGNIFFSLTNTSNSINTEKYPTSSNNETALTSMPMKSSVVTKEDIKISLQQWTNSIGTEKYCTPSDNKPILTSLPTTSPVETKNGSSSVINTPDFTDEKRFVTLRNDEIPFISSSIVTPVPSHINSEKSSELSNPSSLTEEKKELYDLEHQINANVVEKDMAFVVKPMHEPLLTKIVERSRDDKAGQNGNSCHVTYTSKTHVEKSIPVMTDIEKTGVDTNSSISVETRRDTEGTSSKPSNRIINNILSESDSINSPKSLLAATSAAIPEMKDSVNKVLVTDKKNDEACDARPLPTFSRDDSPWTK